MKTAGMLFYQNPIDGSFNTDLLMAIISHKCPIKENNVRNKIMQNLFTIVAY